MIAAMRHYLKALHVVLVLIIVVFVASLFVFGTGGGSGDRENAVAVVNGEVIPRDRYERRKRAVINMYAQMFRQNFTPEMAERLGVPHQVVEDLVQEALVVQRARAEGIAVNDEELNAEVHAIPAFQENGRFSAKRYHDVLLRLQAGGTGRRLTPAAFEEEFRRDLTRRKMENIVKRGVKVSDAEIVDAFAAGREEIRADWALVEIAPLVASVAATDQELETYLRDHGPDFRQPERRRVQYVMFSLKDFAQPVAAAAVEKYYSEHAKEFETPRQALVSHILARVPDIGGSETEDRARAKIADAIRRVKAGEDFAKLARELSEDPASAPKGGDLGFIKQGEMNPVFEQAAFALKKGEVSPEPIRTGFGYHALLVRDVREGGRTPLTQVAAAVRERLSTEAAERAARAKADEMRPPLQSASDLMAEARTLGLAPIETTIARTARTVAADPLEEAAFTLAEGGVSVPVRTPAGFVILKNVAAVPAAVPPLAEIRDKIEAAVKGQKAETLALERAKQIVADAGAGDFLAAAKKSGAVTGDTGRFSRSKPADRLPGGVMLAALQTPVDQLSAPVKGPQGYYVVKVLERVPPNPADLASERDKLARELLAQKQGQAWEGWIRSARARAKIEIFARFEGKTG